MPGASGRSLYIWTQIFFPDVFLSPIILLILLLDSPGGFTCWIRLQFLSLFLLPILLPILLPDSLAGFAHWICSLDSLARFSC